MSELIECVIAKAAAMGALASRLAAAQVLLRAYDEECSAAAAAELNLDGNMGRLGAASAVCEAVQEALLTDHLWTMKGLEWTLKAISRP